MVHYGNSEMKLLSSELLGFPSILFDDLTNALKSFPLIKLAYIACTLYLQLLLKPFIQTSKIMIGTSTS